MFLSFLNKFKEKVYYLKDRITFFMTTAPCDKEIQDLQTKTTALEAQINELMGKIPTTSRDLTDDEKGEKILQSFIKDEPFDNFTFANQPIKIAFLNAAFRTYDLEIVASALSQIRSTLDQEAFELLLDSSPQFRTTYEYLRCPHQQLKIINLKNIPPENRLDYLKTEQQGANDFLKMVLQDEMERSKGKPIYGKEEVDLKWDKIGASLNTNYSEVSPQMLANKFKMMNKWKVNLNPVQTILVMRSLGYPPDVYSRYFPQITSQEQKDELARSGIKVF